jgi:hypothetical protein
MNKRLLSLCLALTTVSVSALAESYGIFVGGVEVTSSNCNNVTGGDIKAYSTSVNGGQPKVTFVKGSGSTPSKLTLWNVKIDRTGNNNRAIHNRDCANLVIVFEGENYLRTTNATAIRIAQNTTIQGHRDSNRKMRTTVISTKENAVRVVSGKKLTIQYGFFNLTADNDDCFDSEDSPELVLESTVVTATSNSTSSDDSYALKNYKSLSISNSTVTLTGYKNAVSGLKDLTLGKGQEDILTPGIGHGYCVAIYPDKELGLDYVTFYVYEWVTSTMTGHYSKKDFPVMKFQMSPKISENFPDANFRSYITSNVDRNEDGYLDPMERLARNTIAVEGMSISDLTGIELFEALNYLYCQQNSLTSLDVSKNTALILLRCYGNQISGEAMTNLVNGLPSATGDCRFLVCDDTLIPDNVITAAQAKVASDKGWTVQKYTGSSTKTYAGLGDVNGDNKIDQTDLNTIVKIIMGQVNLGYAGDLNNDGKTDAADIVVMVNILKSLKRR